MITAIQLAIGLLSMYILQELIFIYMHSPIFGC